MKPRGREVQCLFVRFDVSLGKMLFFSMLTGHSKSLFLKELHVFFLMSDQKHALPMYSESSTISEYAEQGLNIPEQLISQNYSNRFLQD